VLTPKQHEAVGRLTLAFNEIEQMLDNWFPDMLGCAEPTVAFLIARRESFVRQKIAFLEQILNGILEDRPAVESEIKAVITLLGEAKTLNGNRNDYVHSFAFIDNRHKKRKNRMKKKTIDCDKEQILALAGQASDLAMHLSQAFHKLQTALIKARYHV
jgi:hypothetical protein